MTIQEKLIELNACKDAREWAKDKTWLEIFETCHRGDWLLWLFRRTNPSDIKELTRAKAHCALTIRHLMKDQRSINACEVALKFADGQATREELNAAAAAAYAAADAAAAAAYAVAAAAYADADAAADAAAAYAAAAADADAAADAAAAYAAYAVAAAAAAYAADAAAAYAAYAAYAVAAAAAADADAADADAAYAAYADAAYAAYAVAADADAAADAARIKNKKETANICRQYLPIELWAITKDL
jgi:hypothetical protein